MKVIETINSPLQSVRRLRVVLYIRVSTTEQAIEGYSIKGQKTELVKFCELNDYELVNIYIEEGRSGKNTNRPQLQKLLKDAENGMFDGVVVYKLDRFSRSVKDLFELVDFLKSKGVAFISKQEKFDTTTAIGRLFLGFLAILAQFERELIAERVRLGQEAKVSEGKKPGGRWPFGYTNKGEKIPEEFADLRLVRELYMSGMSFQAVAAYMLRAGKLRRGKEWTATTVALSLENILYAGIIRIGSKLPNGKYPARKKDLRVKVVDEPGTHEAVWTLEEYEEHLARMRRRSNGGYSHKTTYWFNGVLRCGRCGAAMYGRLTTSRKMKDGQIKRSAYYWCSRRKANKGCDLPMFRQTHVEHLVMEHIAQIKMDRSKVQEVKDQTKKKTSDNQKEAAKLRRELDKIKSRIKKWQYAFAEDLITADDLRDRMEEEALAESVILSKLELIEEVQDQPSCEQLFELVEIWPHMNDIEKQTAISNIFEKITLHTDVTNVKGVKNAFFPSSAEIKYK